MNFLKKRLNKLGDIGAKERNSFQDTVSLTQKQTKTSNSVLIILLLPMPNLEKKENMEELLDEFFDTLEFKFK